MASNYSVFNLKLFSRLLLFILAIQFLFIAFPMNLIPSQASPSTYPDTIWENFPGNNDDLANAYNLVSESVTNNPDTPLNVSTTSKDIYSFNVYPGFYFQVFIEFNPNIAYYAGSPIDFGLYPGFQADIDIQLLAENNSIIGQSTWQGDSEAIDPIYTTADEIFYVNISAIEYNSDLPYDSFDYSTTYNMSIIFDDVWELFDTNDEITDLSDPNQPSGSDDELVPGVYQKLRFGSGIGNNWWSAHRFKDSYLMWFYGGTIVNLTISSYVDPGNPTTDGPDFYLFNGSRSAIFTYLEDGITSTDILLFNIPKAGWYYLHFDNSYYNTADFYTLYIDIEDSIEGTGNNDNTTAVVINKGVNEGLVTSNGFDDWYKLPVAAQERVSIDITWFSPPTEIINFNLTVYENSSVDSILDEARPIFNGLRFGPYRAFKDAVFLVHVSGDNPYARYYNLTITIDDIDDRFEDNDLPITATLLPATSKTYAPTESDPWAGLFLLQYDFDWYAFPLLPGDLITVRIDFNGIHGNLDVQLFDNFLNVLDSSELVPSNSETVSFRVTRADIYLVVIYGIGAFGLTGIDYNMTVTIDAFDDEFEANDFAPQAAPIAEGHYPDLILRDGSDDWYYVYLHQNDIIEIALDYYAIEGKSGEANDIDLDLLYSDESLAKRSHTLFNESLAFTAPDNGRYYILCVIDGDSNAYNLTINIIETDDIYEDNDLYTDATRITFLTGIPTTSIRHTIADLYIRVLDDDWFVTNVPAGLAIIVELTFLSSENLNLDLYDMNGTIIDTSHLQTGDTEVVGPFPANNTFAGDFYFRVSMPTGLNTFYTLLIIVGPEELLITRQTVPPHGNFSTSKPYKPGPLEDLIIIAGLGALIGGGAAGAFWVANKTGALSKGTEKVKDLLGRGGTSGGPRKKPPTGGKKPPS